MPGYAWRPSGGFRVVYEYASRLVSRGHKVTIVHPRRLKEAAASEPLAAYQRLRKGVRDLRERLTKPRIDWHPVDKRVTLLFVAGSEPEYIPEGDVIFATAWHTVRSVLDCPASKGEKCFLIQGYEAYCAPKDIVDAVWRSPTHKVVVAKWLLELGAELGCDDLTYIPNAVDHDRYKLVQPIEGRPRRVAMLFSAVTIKGASDGIRALEIARKAYPDMTAVLFGTSRRQRLIPDWVEYHRNAPQSFIVKEIYNKSSIFLAPSWTEGFGLPPAEAACCGCAIVATNNGGFRETIQDGVSGLLSPPKDATGLAANLCRLLGNEDLRVMLAKSAYDFASCGLSWEYSTDRFEDFMARVTQHTSVSVGRDTPVLVSDDDSHALRSDVRAIL